MNTIDIIEEHYRKKKNTYVKKITRKCGAYAEDAVQHAYLKAIEYSDKFNAALNFDTWFKRILFTTVSDYRKFANGQPLVDIDENEIDPVEALGFNSAIKYNIWSDIGKIENELEREVVGLHFQYGYKHSEIVHLTGAASCNVQFWLNKFRNFIRDKYNG